MKRTDERKALDDKILNDDITRKWLMTIDGSHSGSTKELYSSVLIDYYNTTKLLPSELIEIAEKESTLTLRKQSISTYLLAYKERLKQLAPTSRATYMAAVVSFYSNNDIPLPKNIIKHDDKPTIQNENKPIDNLIEILPLAFRQSNDLMKLIIAIQFTSGLAMADVISIKVGQLKENDKDNVIGLKFKRQKTNVDFHTFLSPTAKKLACNWIQKMKLEDDDYLVCEKKGEKIDEKHYMYLFRKLSQNIIIKDNEGKTVKGLPYDKGFFNKLHSHNLRKLFYNSMIKISGFGIGELAEYFMGHTIPATRAAYYQADVNVLRKEYMKFVPYFEQVLNGDKI